jgi:hypothetical protein
MANQTSTYDDRAKQFPKIFHGWRHLQGSVNVSLRTSLHNANRLLARSKVVK